MHKRRRFTDTKEFEVPGIHTKPNTGISREWLTPPSILKRLGEFDLDPCCPPGMPWRTAKRMLSNGKASANPGHRTEIVECGLAEEWHGRVFVNPPYSSANCMKWLGKLADHGNGIALVASRTETEWFVEQIWRRAHAVLFIAGRLHYHDRTGKRASGNAGHGSVLVAYGEDNAVTLETCGIRGQLVFLNGMK